MSNSRRKAQRRGRRLPSKIRVSKQKYKIRRAPAAKPIRRSRLIATTVRASYKARTLPQVRANPLRVLKQISSLQQRFDPVAQLKKRVCKQRPVSNKSRAKGTGKSRPFIPWCRRT